LRRGKGGGELALAARGGGAELGEACGRVGETDGSVETLVGEGAVFDEVFVDGETDLGFVGKTVVVFGAEDLSVFGEAEDDGERFGAEEIGVGGEEIAGLAEIGERGERVVQTEYGVGRAGRGGGDEGSTDAAGDFKMAGRERGVEVG
jgi:hypothetical protein